jgi:DNA repair photolyase
VINEITAKSILRKQKRIDSWFISSYAINLYRGCTHNCVYCDGRDVSIKTNAIELLERELSLARKRKPFKGGYMMVCGGVSDSYQHFEKEVGITRRTLNLILKYSHPVHMLTKSTLIERDLDILSEINRKRGAVVSFSLNILPEWRGTTVHTEKLPGRCQPRTGRSDRYEPKNSQVCAGLEYLQRN